MYRLCLLVYIYVFVFKLGVGYMPLRAQIVAPAQWHYALSATAWQVGDELDLHFYARIDSGWFMYASDFDRDLGPVRAEISFKQPSVSYRLVEALKSPRRKQKYDSIWGGEYTYFTHKAHFLQRLRVKSKPLQLAGTLRYQLCSEKTGICVLFEEDFSLESFTNKGRTTIPNKDTSENPSVFRNGHSSGPPDSLPALGTEHLPSSISVGQGDSFSGVGLWGFFFLAFLAGLAALFTPCVFPLIPMTVTYFTDNPQGGRSTAIFYGICIVLIYTLIGFVLAPFMGPELANELATGWIPNVIFFAIFLLFGLSFLGMFEIVLPYRLTNAIEGQAQGKGLLGVFFMAFTLVLVTFSCTGPIVGSVLVQAVGGLKMKPVMGMLGYSLAFALPFSVFALFPKGLARLPKSGGWLNTVKVTLGFLELAFSLKFLSIADQAYHWGILDREIYLSLWIVIFALLGFYLLGKIRLPKDSPVERIGVPRLILALLVFSFVLYLIPGMFGAPLKALAGYLPPQATHDFDLNALGYGRSSKHSAAEAPCGPPLYGGLLHFPHGLQGYFDYEQALACARAEKKPLFVDFTGHGCVNCREMEARVWSDERVLRRLQEDYILVALYIDERTQLPKDKWYTSSYDNKLKKTIGRQNADLQITRFQNNAQPYYVLLGPDEQLLAPPRAYSLDVQGFIDFLDAAKALYMTQYRPLKEQQGAQQKPFYMF